MSREVEVSNISMSATVPEDIQISLGQIGTISSGTITASTKESDASLANGKGGLVNDNGVVTAPANDWDWSNIADVSEYYQFGRLIPSSSNTGTNIYFTPDANGVGKTIKTDARFYTAATSGAAEKQSAQGGASTDTTTTLNATAHVVNAKSNGYVTDKWSEGGSNNYTTSAGWNNTQDDGYYIDIPVWLRTSSVKGANVSVMAYVKPRSSTTNNSNGEALYRALRVAILEETKTAASAAVGSLRSTPFLLTEGTGESAVNYDIINWYNRNSDDKVAVSAINTSAASTATNGTYAAAETYTANATVTSLAAPTNTSEVKSGKYGAAKKLIIRVWLEGEDPDCWNDTAGQDWSINLKFNNETTNSTAGSNADVSGVNTDTAPKPQPSQGGGGNG